MPIRILSRASAVALTTLAMIGQASAHHPTGGQMPTTLVEGLLSGLGHPVIGPDHLAFVLAIGIAAAFVPAGMGLVAAFIAASTAGVLVHMAAIDLPMVEALVAGSVVAAGAWIALGRANGNGVWLVLAALAGIVHGYAFGEAVVGADRAVVGAYLVGLAIVMTALAAVAMVTARRIAASAEATADIRVRAAGAAIACVGVVMLVGGLAG